MPEVRKRYDREFRDGRSGSWRRRAKPIAQVARDLGVNEGTLGNWMARAREAREGAEGLSRGDIDELKRLRAENAELRMGHRTATSRTLTGVTDEIATLRTAVEAIADRVRKHEEHLRRLAAHQD
ncbi:transposase [Pseudonocardia sp. NPDC049154]|uniref:transposase n=1 Tax=Pseudonocardia sp. NPDC049154 TaxID=3155501 RepID=UPI00340B697D